MRWLNLSLYALTIVAPVTAQLVEQEKQSHTNEIQNWRMAREEKLRAENGWLTLVGRYPMKDGPNTFGTGKDNDVVFPAALKGTGPERVGTLQVDPTAKKITLKLAEHVSMTHNGTSFTGERVLGTDTNKRDWVSLERLSMHVIERNGKFVLRLADNESPIRKDFAGCIWYPDDEALRVQARFVPYQEEKTLSIINVIDEVSKQRCPGFAEFTIKGHTYKLDAIQEGDGLFFVFRDETAGDATYKSGRFLDVEKRPADNEIFTLDFNKAYNPPCAFSAFTTCPLPPKQNVLNLRIEAGEKYRARN